MVLLRSVHWMILCGTQNVSTRLLPILDFQSKLNYIDLIFFYASWKARLMIILNGLILYCLCFCSAYIYIYIYMYFYFFYFFISRAFFYVLCQNICQLEASHYSLQNCPQRFDNIQVKWLNWRGQMSKFILVLQVLWLHVFAHYSSSMIKSCHVL